MFVWFSLHSPPKGRGSLWTLTKRAPKRVGSNKQLSLAPSSPVSWTLRAWNAQKTQKPYLNEGGRKVENIDPFCVHHTPPPPNTPTPQHPPTPPQPPPEGWGRLHVAPAALAGGFQAPQLRLQLRQLRQGRRLSESAGMSPAGWLGWLGWLGWFGSVS